VEKKLKAGRKEGLRNTRKRGSNFNDKFMNQEGTVKISRGKKNFAVDVYRKLLSVRESLSNREGLAGEIAIPDGKSYRRSLNLVFCEAFDWNWIGTLRRKVRLRKSSRMGLPSAKRSFLHIWTSGKSKISLSSEKSPATEKALQKFKTYQTIIGKAGLPVETGVRVGSECGGGGGVAGQKKRQTKHKLEERYQGLRGLE